MFVTAAIYLVQIFAGPQFTKRFELTADWYRQPWNVYRLLTYGFLHDPQIRSGTSSFNMFALWTFGKTVEATLRPVPLYVVLLDRDRLRRVWCGRSRKWRRGAAVLPLGASGGVVAVVILFALNFPHANGMVFPIPCANPHVGPGDRDRLDGSMEQSAVREAVAFTAHLGGSSLWMVFLSNALDRRKIGLRSLAGASIPISRNSASTSQYGRANDEQRHRQ